jgi:hypothetical protein
MTVKLNLTVDEKTANKIKRYAKKRQTSVSKIAEAHFQGIIKAEERKALDFFEKTAGMIKGIEIGDLKEAITKAIE